MQIQSIEDPRFGWELLRRKQLEHIAVKEGISFKHGSPATTLRVLLNDVDPAKYQYLVYPDALHGNTSMEQKPPNLEEEIRHMIKEVSYDEMSLGELQKECELQNIPYHHKNSEKTLRAKLNGNTT